MISETRTTYLYDVVGRVTTLTYGNSARAETQYDDAGRVQAVRNRKSDGTAISIFTYTYDNANNRTGVAEANGDLVSWSYDEANQLTQEQRTGVNDYIYAYSYDEVGNRLTKNDGAIVVSYSYDEANQLTVKWNPTVVVTYSYDANGNTTVENNAGQLTTSSWDLENRVTGVQLPAGGLNTMTYDGDGKRRSYADSVILRNFLWDGENIARQTDVNNLTDRNYTLNPQLYGELISQDGPAFHHYDALGSTRNLTDTNQAVTDTRDYTAFGETNASSGTNLNRFWWLGKCGYYLQPDLGNVWVRARIEEPVDGRMKTRDPIIRLRALWPYLYCKNRPTRLVDPSGLDASKCPCDGLRQQVRDLVNEIERKSSHWGFRQAACGRLNELVATAGRKCNDHRFDDTYRKDCGEIRKRKKWNECMTLCTSDPDTYVPGFNKASLANTGVDAVLDIIKSGGSPDSPTPGDFHGGTFREDAKGACTEYCRRRWGWVPLPEPEYLTQEDVHDLFISPMETTLGPG